MMIYIVIPVFNRWDFTKACLDMLREQSYKKFKVVVVNDGSSDETKVQLATNYPEVIELQGDGNLWWAGSMNLGVQYALDEGAEYILSLNNDTLPKKNYLENLKKAYEKSPNSLIGSTGIDAKSGQINYCGEQLIWLTDSSKDLRRDIDESQINQLLPTSYFPGRGLFIPKIVFEAIGLFDNAKFPHYFADYDFTLRAKKAGFLVFCSVDSKIATYPEASGANQLMIRKSFKNYKDHLFGIKGAANLKYYYSFIIRHCPWFILPINFGFGTTKRLINYWLK